MTITWLAPTRYAQTSACGWYSVAKYHIGGDAPLYEAWRRRAHPDGMRLIGGRFASAAEARAAVEQHHLEIGRADRELAESCG